MQHSMTIKTPGKLMVAGEFAVLEPYHRLVVMAVNRFVYTKIKTSDKNEVTLTDFQLSQIGWEFVDDTVIFSIKDSRLSFVRDAIRIALTYLKENHISPQPFSLTITSELDDNESGVKYGLGSSAAVVTSIITAILTKISPSLVSEELIFKLASISHIKTQGNGSGADIAASTYGGVLQYTSFQADWLKAELEEAANLSSIVNKNWKYLSVEPIQFPTSLQICIGWTGTPASTGSLVDQILMLKSDRPEQYADFLQKSKQAVQFILTGMENDDEETFLTGIRLNREALAQLGNEANVEIETEKLYRLGMEAEQYEGAGKLSGAGGGDCGIAFIPVHQSARLLHDAWRKTDIMPLHLTMYPKGVTQTSNE